MISEPQQEAAALYALGLLDADEAASFERLTDADADLRALVRELRESSALLAFRDDGSVVEAPPALRERVLSEVRNRQTGDKRAASSRIAWLPWALAALCMGGTAALWWVYADQQTQIHELSQRSTAVAVDSAMRANFLVDPAQISICALEPTPQLAATQPRAAVLWDAVHRRGKLRVNQLAPPAEGKDYQLWAVETDRKEPVSAGVVRVDADGKATVPFRPVDQDAKPVVAVAISLEQAGGSPTNKGPILLLGKF